MTFIRQPVIGDQSNNLADSSLIPQTVIKLADGVYGGANSSIQVTIINNQIVSITQNNIAISQADFLAQLRALPGWDSSKDYLALTTDGANGVKWKPVSLT